jgi:hypothetical protein
VGPGSTIICYGNAMKCEGVSCKAPITQADCPTGMMSCRRWVHAQSGDRLGDRSFKQHLDGYNFLHSFKARKTRAHVTRSSILTKGET